MPSPQKIVRMALLGAFICYSFLTLLYIPYRSLSNDLAILLLAAVLTSFSAALILWLPKREFSFDIEIRTGKRLFWFIVAGGIVVRVIFVTVFPPIQQSDFLTYVRVACRLLEEGRYYYPNEYGELLAWRPPGYPFLLAAGIKVFGNVPWLPLAINLVCFTVTVLAIRSLAERLTGKRIAGLFAVALIAFWPDAIAGAGLAASEWPSLALLTVGILAIIKAQEGSLFYSVLAGLCMGYCALMRPGLMLLPVCWLIYFAIGSPFNKRILAINLVAASLAFAVIAPWTVRNYRVLNGFVPISTNGGSVFYRANNPLADGSYTRRGERDIDALSGDEVEWNRTGFIWGEEWIKSNPLGFLVLVVKKQAIFSGSDSDSLYWAVERGQHETGRRYVALRCFAQTWWIVVMLMMSVASIRCRHQLFGSPHSCLIIATILYVLAVHSVFESQARHHQPLYGLIAILVTMAIWQTATPTEKGRLE